MAADFQSGEEMAMYSPVDIPREDVAVPDSLPESQFEVVGGAGPEVIEGPAQVTSSEDTAKILSGGMPAMGGSKSLTELFSMLKSAKAEVPPSVSIDPEAKKILGGMVGDLPKGEIAKLVGAPGGSNVSVSAEGGEVFFDVSGKGFSANRSMRTEEGKLVMSNDAFYVDKDKQGGGLGTDVLSRQVEALQKYGFDRIDTGAVRDQESVGYYTWPRLGYDAQLDEEHKAALPQQFRNVDRISELMQTPEGREAWKQHGSTIEASFDLTPGSQSIDALRAYRQEKGLPPLKAMDEGGYLAEGEKAVVAESGKEIVLPDWDVDPDKTANRPVARDKNPEVMEMLRRGEHPQKLMEMGWPVSPSEVEWFHRNEPKEKRAVLEWIRSNREKIGFPRFGGGDEESVGRQQVEPSPKWSGQEEDAAIAEELERQRVDEREILNTTLQRHGVEPLAAPEAQLPVKEDDTGKPKTTARSIAPLDRISVPLPSEAESPSLDYEHMREAMPNLAALWDEQTGKKPVERVTEPETPSATGDMTPMADAPPLSVVEPPAATQEERLEQSQEKVKASLERAKAKFASPEPKKSGPPPLPAKREDVAEPEPMGFGERIARWIVGNPLVDYMKGGEDEPEKSKKSEKPNVFSVSQNDSAKTREPLDYQYFPPEHDGERMLMEQLERQKLSAKEEVLYQKSTASVELSDMDELAKGDKELHELRRTAAGPVLPGGGAEAGLVRPGLSTMDLPRDLMESVTDVKMAANVGGSHASDVPSTLFPPISGGRGEVSSIGETYEDWTEIVRELKEAAKELKEAAKSFGSAKQGPQKDGSFVPSGPGKQGGDLPEARVNPRTVPMFGGFLGGLFRSLGS